MADVALLCGGGALGAAPRLASFAPGACLVYFHLLLRGLERQGLLDRPSPS